jgi:hypothetical protein
MKNSKARQTLLAPFAEAVLKTEFWQALQLPVQGVSMTHKWQGK